MSEVISQARAFLATSQPEKALELLSSHIGSDKNSSSSPELLSIFGETLLENNQLEEAYQVLTTACQLDPEAKQGAEKYLYLGQIIGGRDGLNYINTGLNKLNEYLAEVQGGECSNQIIKDSGYESLTEYQKWLLKKLNSGIFASIEIWMTDLCMEEEAESKCNELIEYSLSLDSTNPESYSQLSSIRISQQRNQDAIEALVRAWDLFQAKKTKLEDYANVIKEEEKENDAFEVGMEYVELIQPLLTLSKYAVELEQYEIAIDIVSNVQDINDSILDAFYIEAIAYLFKAKKIISLLDKAQLDGNNSDATAAAADYRDIEIKKLKMCENEEIKSLVNDARLCLTSGYKIINSELTEECDPTVIEQVNDLLNQLDGPIISELMPKKEKNEDDNDDWEAEIEYED
ncbi:hypothetical protein KGF56_001252 [Candida oxycetoniae]|uniref:Assembly chaperone of RPL4 n=1 Tax=Candida oxycetoniae TaxID=497107 RepID=A0AAI9SZI5_9ASCO|nr:uncharacterized protein KGF56_001252 [Candida oxycetoniae]KAI3406033.2 hypothetical protein KGF56_001252 [Candida oxycetoniae]